jgi:hypothetical protein
MSFFTFQNEDLIETYITTNPSYVVELNGNIVTGSIYLEKTYLKNDLETRVWQGYSELSGGYITKQGPFSSSIDILDAEDGATNKQLYKAIIGLYNYYDLFDSDYTPNFTGSISTRFRVITIPEIYYDNSILTGSLTASDVDADGSTRTLYDNGRGGVFSGSLSGTIVGNIFYNEGLVVLKGSGLNVESPNSDFGEVSSTNFKWRVRFKGVHRIPVKVFRCHAPAGQLNASTNPTFFKVLTGSTAEFRNEKQLVLSQSLTYITTVGLYNEDYELVGMAKLAQPIKKEVSKNYLFKIRLDF